jgi:hypothetical protein
MVNNDKTYEPKPTPKADFWVLSGVAAPIASVIALTATGAFDNDTEFGGPLMAALVLAPLAVVPLIGAFLPSIRRLPRASRALWLGIGGAFGVGMVMPWAIPVGLYSLSQWVHECSTMYDCF